MTQVELPDGSIAEFPAGMSEDQILAALNQLYRGETDQTPDGRAVAPGTTPYQAGNIPPEMVYNPKTGAYDDTSSPAFKTAGRAGGVNAALQGAGQGMSLGFMDEAVAGLYGLTGPGTFDQNQQYALARQRADLERNRSQNPGAFLGGQFAGGMAVPGGTAGSVAGAAVRGGLAAGAQEFGEGEGGVLERLQGVPEAVGTGMIGAGLLDGAVRGISRVARGKAPAREGLDSLNDARRAAYAAVDEAGETFSADEVTDLVLNVQQKLDDADYVGGFGQKTDQVLARLYKLADRNEPITLGSLDDVRKRLWKAYSSAQDEVEILDAIGAIDDLIDSRGASSQLMSEARRANSLYKKREMLELAFQKAEDQTAGAGSGGNIANKYKQAVTSIINNPRKSKWFNQQELDNMRGFVRGNMSGDMLRRAGKLSPDGNGLMLALNIGAIATDPSFLAATATGAAAKAMADRGVTTGKENILDMVTGFQPQRPLQLPAAATGVLASQEEAQASIADYLANLANR